MFDSCSRRPSFFLASSCCSLVKSVLCWTLKRGWKCFVRFLLESGVKAFLLDYFSAALKEKLKIGFSDHRTPWKASKILKSREGVNFTNILQATFSANFLLPKTCKHKCKYKKAVQTLPYEKSAWKMLAQSAIVLVHRAWCNQFHQQNFAQLYQYTQLEVTYNFYAEWSAKYASKFSINLLALKLLVK